MPVHTASTCRVGCHAMDRTAATCSMTLCRASVDPSQMKMARGIPSFLVAKKRPSADHSTMPIPMWGFSLSGVGLTVGILRGSFWAV
eukprot:scaffold258290_cov31-Tisochrysis_lutea.AAC.3